MLGVWFKNVALHVAKVRLTCERNAHYAHDYKILTQKIYMQVRSPIQLVRVNSQKTTCSSENNNVLLGGGPVVGPRYNAKVWSYMDLCSYVVAGQLDSRKNFKLQVGIMSPANRKRSPHKSKRSQFSNHLPPTPTALTVTSDAQ